MQLETALRWSWMNVLTLKRAEALKAQYKSLDAALSHISLEMLQSLGCREQSAMLAMNRLEEFDADAHVQLLRKKGIHLLAEEDDDYPAALRTVPDRPVFLYVRGDLSILARPCIALVGSREMNDEGSRIVERFIPDIVAAGCTTVSGLAYGVDAAVASETLRASGKTVAVLGGGLGSIYPKAHATLAETLVEEGGLIVSEFPFDMQPDKFTFPARNRIIAGLSLATVVVQAAEDSGSLITAELALEYGRDVCAVPGSVFDPLFAGCHRIIGSGQAKLVTCAEDVLQEVGIVSTGRAPEASVFESDDPQECAVVASLSSLPVALDDLVIQAKLDAATVTALLTVLELKGAARKVGGKWIRA